MFLNRITRVALRSTPQRIRKQGRPKVTSHRTVEKEINAMRLTWVEAEMVALDIICCRQFNKIEAKIEAHMHRAELRARKISI